MSGIKVPEPYADIASLSNNEILIKYGSKVMSFLNLNSDPKNEQFDSVIMEQIAEDTKVTTAKLFDPHVGEEIIYGEFVKKYGRNSAEEAERGHHEPETRKSMKEKHEAWVRDVCVKGIALKPSCQSIDSEIITKSSPAAKGGKTYTGARYFLKTTRGLIGNPEYRAVFKEKGCSVIYEYMWAHIVRAGWVDTPEYPIKEKYYDNGFLAYCSSYRYLAKECALDKNYVHKIVDRFNDRGIIKLEMLVPKGKKFGQMVAILGEWKSTAGSIEESFYRDQIFVPA